MDWRSLDERVGGLAPSEGTATASSSGASSAAGVTLGFGGILRSTLSGGSRAVSLKTAGSRPTPSEARVYDEGTTLGVGALELGSLNALRRGAAANLSLTGGTPDAGDAPLLESGGYFRFSSGTAGLLTVPFGFGLNAAHPGSENVTTTVSSGGSGVSVSAPASLGQGGGGGSGIDERISLLGAFNSADLNNVMAVNQFAGSGANFSIGVIRSGGGLQPLNAVPEFSPIYAGGLLLGIFGWTERRRLRRLFPRPAPQL